MGKSDGEQLHSGSLFVCIIIYHCVSVGCSVVVVVCAQEDLLGRCCTVYTQQDLHPFQKNTNTT